jgi:hypothetical protein
MKKYLLSLFALLACMALFLSCEEDIEKRQVTFTAAMPADDLSSSRPGSIINGVPAADGFNLSAQWKDGDRIQIFIRQDGIVYQADSPSTVYDISSDGKTCSFMVTLPKSVNRDKDYDIIGVTGIEAYIDGEDIIALCTMKRVGIDGNDSPILPMWFTSKKGSNQAKFRHMCAYEVLNVDNCTNSSIRFKHGGFNVMTPWYKYSDKVVLTSNGFSGYEAGQTDAESNEITIPAWETGTIVTYYIPKFDVTDETDEATINNAKLKALVNGSAVTSTDALKAYKNFARGNAYYMQATWDGSNLYFSNDFCPDGNHPHMIDLGLPSGTKWACCNVGANTPSEYGDYFAWGETAPKSAYLSSNYKWYIGGDNHNISKYCTDSNYGIVDNRTELEPEDDAAYVNWGPEWRMPSLSHMYELLNNCTSEWTMVNGIDGYLFKSNTNERAVFFPAAGFYNIKGLKSLGTGGAYWLSIYFYNYRPDLGICLTFLYGNMGTLSGAGFDRQSGATVRAVYIAQE